MIKANRLSAALAMFVAAALGVVVVAAVSVAPTQAGSARPGSGVSPGSDRDACFDPTFVRGFQTVNDHKVIITSDRNQAYEVELAGVCIGLDTSFQLGIRSRHGSMDVCGPFDADVVWEDMGRLQSCPISSVRHLTGDEAAPYVYTGSKGTGERHNGGRAATHN